ncbi:MAG: SCO family protein [Nitrosomonadales bacterium]|nr:SCO family protein [Nitrosomonadales bacterium]
MKIFGPAIFAAMLTCISPAGAETPHAGEEVQQEAGIVPRYLLMDYRGRAVTNEDFPGSFQLISFGYTFCPDVCPTTLSKMSLIMEKLGKQADRLQPLFITVDPERDTPEVLHRYIAFFNPRIIGLTGSPELVRRAADNFKVKYEKYLEPGAAPNRYAVDHSVGMYLLGPDGRFLARFAYGMPFGEMAERIRALMEEYREEPAK